MREKMKRKQIINISEYYLSVAEKDKKAGDILASQGLYNQALYFQLQYMEKFIKSEISKKIDIKNIYTREFINKHSIEELILFLVDILEEDGVRKEQLKTQIESILGRINYKALYNNIRYPYFKKDNNSFFFIEYSKDDYENLVNDVFEQLKRYIKELYRL